MEVAALLAPTALDVIVGITLAPGVLLIAITARHLGAGKVTLCDPSADKQAVARDAGVDAALAPQDLGAGKFDVVFEAAGVPAALSSALSRVEKTGAMVQVGALVDPAMLVEIEADAYVAAAAGA